MYHHLRDSAPVPPNSAVLRKNDKRPGTTRVQPVARIQAGQVAMGADLLPRVHPRWRDGPK